MDCPNGALLAETSVIGAVGHYKLRIPTSKHSLAFHTSPGDPVSTDINLLNTGSVNFCILTFYICSCFKLAAWFETMNLNLY